ncbi:MAG: SDR family oxidoreductase [Burkholderiaceae bacterium]|nr:SDR family oxidoreductase [Burkholderiaceae bacterium]
MTSADAPTVLVTGGARGIGAAVSRRLAGAGRRVVICYRADDAAAGALVDAIQSKGGSALALRADVASEADVQALFDRIDAEYGRLDGLVNNAGVVAPGARVETLTCERLERIFAVNVIGSFLCAGQAVRRMSSRRGGRGGAIVNISSIAARLGSAGEYVDYAASKAAIDTLTIGLAREVAEEGIRVNAVRPGFTLTEIHANNGSPGRVERLAGTVPMKRGASPDEIAAAVAWLLSDEASYVTGALLDVGGGR